MRVRRLVPTLAACAFAGVMAAQDGVAPVTTMNPSDAILQPWGTMAAPSGTPLQENDSDPAVALDVGANLLPDLFVYSTTYGWEALGSNSWGTTGGVAVVGADSSYGTWQYRTNLGTWNDINEGSLGELTDQNALLLSTISAAGYSFGINNDGLQVRFLPLNNAPGAATSDFDSTLVFRVWDGSNGLASGSTADTANSDPFAPQSYGGSPTPYSAETRTLTVHVQHTNQSPTLDAIPPDIYVEQGGTIHLAFTASDPEGDTLTWSHANLGYTFGLLTDPSSSGTEGDFTFVAGSTVGDQLVQISVSDGIAAPVVQTTTIHVVSGSAPTITATTQAPYIVTMGSSLPISFASSDVDDDNLTWSNTSLSYGSGGFSSGQTSAGANNTFTYTPSQVGTENVTFTVDDGRGLVNTVTLTITVQPSPNHAPTFNSIDCGNFAIVGQPFSAIVRAGDVDTGDLANLTLSAGTLDGAIASVVSISGHPGYFKVNWLPTQPGWSDGSEVITLTLRDGHGSINNGVTTTPIYVQYIDNVAPGLVSPTIPLSTPGDVVYAAIAPGSGGAYGVLNNFLNAHSIDSARSYWWTGSAYAELPGSQPADPRRNAAFLAATVPANLTFNPDTLPAPFTIDVPANRWVFFGVPPLLLDSSLSSPTQSHDLSFDFDYVDLDGTSYTLPTVYGYDSSARDYASVSTISTGTGYWIRNSSGSPRQLVRLANYNLGAQALAAVHARRAAAVATASSAEKPPPPPSSSQKADGGGSGGCGAGGIAGLIAAAMAMFGLRRGRRS